MNQENSLITTPTWVSPETPRFVRDWNESSKVYVTTWGDRVHLFAECPGTKGFDADPTVKQVPLSSRVCTARTACRRCFGEFWSGTSIEELNHLIAVLHGRIDEGPHRRTGSVIAEKIRRRYLGADASPTGHPSDPTRLVTSQSDPKKRRPPTKKIAPPRPGPTKAEAKRERDRAAAEALGLSVGELKAQRRAEAEANRRRNGQARKEREQ